MMTMRKKEENQQGTETSTTEKKRQHDWGVLTAYNQGRQRWESMGNDTDHSTNKTEGLPSL